MAQRFWVGGGSSTNWSATANTNWAATSGGAGNQTVPGSGDDVFFDGNSGAGTSVLDAGFAGTVNSIDCTGYGGTLQMDRVLTIAGAGVTVKFVNTMTVSGSSKGITFSATSAGTNNFTTGGRTFGTIVLGTNVVSSTTVKLQDALNAAVIQAGGISFHTNTFGVTLSSGASAIVNLGGTAAALWTISGSTFTISTGGVCNWPAATTFTTDTGTTMAYTNTNNGGAAIFPSNGDTTVTNTNGAGTGWTFIAFNSVNPTIRNLTFTGPSTKQNWCMWSAGKTFTFTGTLTINGNSAVNRIAMSSNDDAQSTGLSKLGTSFTLNAAAVSLSNVNIADCTGAGAASPFTGTSLGDCQGNSGITFTASASLFWFKDTGNWDDSTKWFLATNGGGGAGRVPLPQDDVFFDANSFSAASKTVSTNGYPALCRNMTWTGATNNPTFQMNVYNCAFFGDITLVSGMSLTQSGGNVTAFCKRGTININDAGKSWPQDVFLAAPGGTWTVNGSFTMTTGSQFFGFGLMAGTFDTGGNACSITIFRSNGASGYPYIFPSSTVSRTLNLNGSTFTVAGTGGTSNQPWLVGTTGFTVNPGTSTIKFTGSTSTAQTYTWGTYTYNNVWWAGNLGTHTRSFDTVSQPTFADFKIDTGPATYKFPASKTITVKSFTVNGTSGNLITLQSTTGGTANTLTSSTGLANVCSFLSIQDSHATAGAFIATGPSTNVSGNTGWIFATAVSQPSNATATAVGLRQVTITATRKASDVAVAGRKTTVTSIRLATRTSAATVRRTITATRSASRHPVAIRGVLTITTKRAAVAVARAIRQTTITAKRMATVKAVGLGPPRRMKLLASRIVQLVLRASRSTTVTINTSTRTTP